MKNYNKTFTRVLSILVFFSFILTGIMMLVSCGDSGVAIQSGDTSDTDSYQNTTNDSQTTQENTTDVTPQPDKVNMSSPSESEMSKIYERAVAAKENKEYQYSYALFSYLATKGYRDSVSQAADGRMLGLAEKIATTGLANVAGGENCSVSGISDDDFTEGYLYIAEGGVPTFVYLSGGETVSIIPDSTLKDVVSIVKFITPYYEFFVCLKNDGTLSAIYNPAVCDDESGAAQTFNSLLAFLSSQKNVVQVSAGDDFECAVLLSDGTLSLFCLPQFHLGYSENIDRVKNWRDVAYISFGRYSALGVKNNGEVLCEKLSYSSYSQGELSAYQNLIDNNITLQAVQGIINDGKLYLRYPDKKATYSVEDGKFAWEIEYHEFEDVVWSDRGCNVAIDIYGQVWVCSYKQSAAPERIDGTAYLTEGCKVRADGSISCIEIYGQSENPLWKLHPHIKVEVR